MKKLFTLLLAVILLISLCACAAPTQSSEPETEAPQSEAPEEKEQKGEGFFTLDNYPKMGGSLAALPLGEALTANALDLTREEATKLLTFDGSTTSNYERLRDGTFDIILAYEPAEEVTYTDEFEFTPIGVDALVFITGKNNTVENLTSKEISKIFNGKITNWSEVGGEDKAIVPYIRNPESGSHTLFEIFFDLESTDHIKNEYVVGSMMGLLEAIADYKGTDEAIGYTVHYYLTKMEASTLETSKLIAVDGVMPSFETIEDGSYKLSNQFYVVIRKDAEVNSPERILYNWIASEQGKQIAHNEGYVVELTVAP